MISRSLRWRRVLALLAATVGVDGLRCNGKIVELARRGAAGVGLAVALSVPQSATASQQFSVEQRFVAEAWRETDRLFYERTFNGLDWFGERRSLVSKSYSSGDEAREAVKGMLSKLGDRYTRYVTPDEYEKLVAATSGDASVVAGAGVQLVDGAEGPLVVDVEPRAPGDAGGMRPGDVVVRVGGVAVNSAAEAARALRGEAGSVVEAELRRGESTATAKIARAVVSLSSVRYDDGVVRIRSFSLETPTLVKEKLEENSAAAKKIVIDLRGNGGGSLEGGVETARLFLRQGQKLVTVVDKKGVPLVNTALVDGPFVGTKVLLLVDDKTASAAEVFAGALVENDAAALVGAQGSEHTFGKGVIQQLTPLGSPPGTQGAVAVTLAKYTTPAGTDINGRGLPVDKIASPCSLKDSARVCVSRLQ